MKEVVVVDYGLGNILSVVRAFEYLGCGVRVATSPRDLRAARKIVLPGVGAFPSAMRRLQYSGLNEAIISSGTRGIPLLGICLGMQLLMSTSHEHAETQGLGLIEGEVRQITLGAPSSNSRLPEIGWRKVLAPLHSTETIKAPFATASGKEFYFVHSYQVQPREYSLVTGVYSRANSRIVASIAYGNILGVQYHPEKSGKSGLLFLDKFISLNP